MSEKVIGGETTVEDVTIRLIKAHLWMFKDSRLTCERFGVSRSFLKKRCGFSGAPVRRT